MGIAIAMMSAPAEAQWRAEASLHVAYLIAGGGARGRAPATGGAAIMPAGRLLYALRIADPYVAVAPSFVAPQSLDALGFVGALDAGAAWHPPSRAWYAGTAVTLAPSYLRLCNAVWCLKEAVLLYGAESHFSGCVVRTESGGLFAGLAARLLTGRPTAWYWPRLARGDADVSHLIVSIGGHAIWRF